MEVAIRLRSIISKCGIEPDGRVNFKFVIFVTVHTILMVDMMAYIFYNWADLNGRFGSIKALILWIGYGTAPFYIYLGWSRINMLLGILGTGCGERQLDFPGKDRVLEQMKKGTIKKFEFIYRNLCYYFSFTNLITLTTALYQIIRADSIESLDIKTLPVHYMFYYPENYDTFSVYIVAFILLAIMKYTAALGTIIVFSMSTISLRNVVNEIRLIRLSLNGLWLQQDSFIRTGSQHGETKGVSRSDLITDKFRRIVLSHQDLYRKTNDIQYCVGVIMFIQNYVLSSVICVCAYLITEKEGFSDKVIEGCMALICAYLLFGLNSIGENILEEDKMLRETLYGSEWVEKPLWFKRSLLMILARMNRELEIKPFGLFAMNIKNFSAFMNAVYSCYNLLNRLKSQDTT